MFCCSLYQLINNVILPAHKLVYSLQRLWSKYRYRYETLVFLISKLVGALYKCMDTL